MNFEILIGFLSGSLITLIVKEVLNQINKKIDFNRELNKITYVRKLDKAENAIAFYYNYLNRIIEMKKSLEVVMEAIKELDKKDYDVEIIQNILEQNGKLILELTSAKYFDINSIHLYFELEDTAHWDESDVFEFLKALSETKSIDQDIELWIDFYNSHLEKGDFHNSNYYWSKALELIPSYIDSLQNLIYRVEKIKLASNSFIQKIKTQLKIY